MNQGMAALKKYFGELTDPRAQYCVEHCLNDIVLITICAVICGAESWVDIENYGLAKQEWLSRFLGLPNGIPSHDTFERLFARLRPAEVQECFLNWVEAVFDWTDGSLIRVDGKTLRGSYERGGKRGMIHMVSAWASLNRIVLGQRKVEEKSNEITAIPELLRILDLAGAIVSIDAMGCQREIATQIVEQEVDYVLALKGNQGHLYEAVQQQFKQGREQDFQDMKHDYYQTEEYGHGRREVRQYWVIGETDSLPGAQKWSKLTAIGCVESERQVNDKISHEFRYYLLSCPFSAEGFANTVRGHWSIENQLHWILDVGFHEDQARSTSGHSAENLAVLRHLAVSLLAQDESSKGGTRAKRLKAGWDDRYLLQLLAQTTPPRKRRL